MRRLRLNRIAPAAALMAVTIASGAARAAPGYQLTILPSTIPGAPAGDIASVDAISNVGQLLFSVSAPGSVLEDASYLYSTVTHSYTVLPNDPTALPGSTYYSGLNDNDQFVGYYQPTTLGTYQSFLQSGGVFTNVTPPPSYQINFSNAVDLNDAGQIVGSWELSSGNEQGYELSGGTYTTIDIQPFPGTATFPEDINNSGVIVGLYTPVPGGTPPASGFEDIGGVMTDITDPGQLITAPLAINDSGEIVGLVSNDPDQVTAEGFVDVGGNLTTFAAPGAISTDLYGVNDQGQIIGFATEADGTGYSFLLTPSAVPEPAAWAMMLVGIGGLGAALRGWRRPPSHTAPTPIPA